MSETPKRRWYQFGLGTMFWFISFILCFLFALRERRRAEMWQSAADAWVSLNAQMTQEDMQKLDRQKEAAQRDATKWRELYYSRQREGDQSE